MKTVLTVLALLPSIIYGSHLYPILSSPGFLPELAKTELAGQLVNSFAHLKYGDEATLIAAAPVEECWSATAELGYCLPLLNQAISHVEQYFAKECEADRRPAVIINLIRLYKDVALVEKTEDAIEQECWGELLDLVASIRSVFLRLIKLLFKSPEVPRLQDNPSGAPQGRIFGGGSGSVGPFIIDAIPFNERRAGNDRCDVTKASETAVTISGNTEVFRHALYSLIEDLIDLQDKDGLEEFVLGVEEILVSSGASRQLDCGAKFEACFRRSTDSFVDLSGFLQSYLIETPKNSDEIVILGSW